eukprot:GHVU01047496.1.p1 GENE.GHVU01047496.1~~GHVU01047496.1.p1  ORF type:complete len:110 (+),score=12.28 GHVU01047496.1:456-785(+)
MEEWTNTPPLVHVTDMKRTNAETMYFMFTALTNEKNVKLGETELVWALSAKGSSLSSPSTLSWLTPRPEKVHYDYTWFKRSAVAVRERVHDEGGDERSTQLVSSRGVSE